MHLYADGNDSIANRLFWTRTFDFELDTVSVFLALLPLTSTVVDVGANTGIYAILAGLTPEESGTLREVYAFEPVPQIYGALRRNLALNHLSHVRAECSAVGDVDGETTLYIPADVMYPTGASTLKGLRHAVEEINVVCRRLDTYFSEISSTVDLIKIDTEATEPAVLKGAQQLLERDKPFIICEVLPGRTEAALESLLHPLGYRYFWITDDGIEPRTRILGDRTEQHLNYLFAHPDRMREIVQRLGLSTFESVFAHAKAA